MQNHEKGKRVNFANGAILIDQGDSPTNAYLIVEGKVEVRSGKFGDGSEVLAICERGDMVGELALIENRPHLSCVVALEDTVVRQISAQEFNDRLNKTDTVMQRVIHMLARRLRETSHSKAEDANSSPI